MTKQLAIWDHVTLRFPDEIEAKLSAMSPVTSTFSLAGVLAVTAGKSRWYNPTTRTLTLVSVRASVNTAPTGAAVIVDITKSGVTIFTTQANRPTIAISGFTALAGAAQITTLAAGEYLTVDCDQIGTTVAGADLTVTVVYA